MSWEALSALASTISSVAVLIALVIALRQVRVGAAQVEHLRRATQLDGTMKIFALLASPEQVAGRRFIFFELPERMRDPAFRAEVESFSRLPVGADHMEIGVMRLMEMIGTYVKHDLLDSEIVFDHWQPAVTSTWERLDALGVIAAHRAATVPEMWENFEDLYVRAQRWLAAPPLRPAQRVARVEQAAAVADVPGDPAPC